MSINFHKYCVFCILLFTYLLSNEWAIGQQRPKWRIKNRLQTSYEYDSNIRESPSSSLNSIHDSSFRLLFNSRAWKINKSSRILFSYRGGLQTYLQNAGENKLINEGDFSTAIKAGQIVTGIRGSGRLKIYLNQETDYVNGAAEAFIQFPQILNFKNELAYTVSGLNYQNFSRFNYSENQIKWSILRNISQKVKGRLVFSGKQIIYNRTVNFMEDDPNLGLKQKDRNYKILFQLNYSKSFLLNAQYSFQQNNSNSRGYSYKKHQITLIFGLPLMQTMWLRGYGAFQIKHYREEVVQIFPLDIDTEREESNFFILDCSKDLNSNISALLRFAYYNNESVIRKRFYNKSLLTLGFDFRF